MTSIIQDLVQEVDRIVEEKQQKQRQEGRAEGITVGIDQASTLTAKTMIEAHEPLSKILSYSRLAEDVITSLSNSLGIPLVRG